MVQKTSKVLVIRFSSFGDIVQAMECLSSFEGTVDWVTRQEFEQLVRLNQKVAKVWAFDRTKGLIGLLSLGWELRKEGYTHIYDAHSNTRSMILRWLFRVTFSPAKIIRRKKYRLKRFLLFFLRVNRFPWPFRGRRSYLEELKKWKLTPSIQSQSWNFSSATVERWRDYKDSVVLIPSAAWEMKRWPLDSWKKLITLGGQQKFIVLGGPDDHFCEELVQVAPDRVTNLAGKLDLVESSYVLSQAKAFISADTGLLHVGDIMGVKGIALIGPSAFGFPSGEQVKTLSVDLECRPCSKDGRGNCSQEVYQKCMVTISPEEVNRTLEEILAE